METTVTDPKLLAELEAMVGQGVPTVAEPTAGSTVTNPALLAELESASEQSVVPQDPKTGQWKPEPPSAEQSVVPHAFDRFKSGVAGFLSIAASPISAVDTVLEFDGITKKGETPLGYGMAKRGWDSILGVKNVPAPTVGEGKVTLANEYIGNIAEFAGGMLIPGAGAVKAAEQKLATAIVTSLGTVSSGMWATHGKHFGRDLAPSFGVKAETGEMIGYAIGSMGGTKVVGLLGQGLTKSINSALAAADKLDLHGTGAEAQKIAANKLLLKEIQQSLELNPTSPENLSRALELVKKVEGFNPNIAQRSNAPGLVAMYNQVANKSPEALAKAAAAEQRNLAAIAAYKEKVFPPAPSWRTPLVVPKDGRLTPVTVTEPAKLKLETNRRVNQLEVEKANSELTRLSDAFRTRADNGKIGEELRSLYWQARKPVTAALDQEIGQVYATAKRYGIVDDMTDVREGIQKILAMDRNTFQGPNMPRTFQQVLDQYPEASAGAMKRVAVTPAGAAKPVYRMEGTPAKPGNSTATFEEVHSLYKQANREWIDAVAAGQSTKAHYLAAIRDQLQGKVAKYNDPKYGELGEKFSQFNQNYSRYSTTFKEGAGGEIAKRGRGGLATDAEDIVAKVILQAGDKKKGVEDFLKIYGQDTRAAELLHDGVLDNFAKAVMKSGTLNPVAARNWLHQHQAALGELPEIQKALGNTTRMAQELVNRKLLLQKQRSVLDRTELAKIAKREDVDKLITDAVAQPRLMKGLLAGAYSTESKQAIARAIADNVAKQPNSYEYLVRNEATLAPVMERLGKGHWQNLKDIAELERIAARTKAPTAVELGKVQDIGQKYLGISVQGLFSRARNSATPLGQSPGFLVTEMGGKYLYKIRSEELARLRETAMFDTDTAALLAQLGKKRGGVTHKELLDLQRLSYNAGVNSVVQSVEEHRRAEGEGKVAFGRAPKVKTVAELAAERRKTGGADLRFPKAGPQHGATVGW